MNQKSDALCSYQAPKGKARKIAWHRIIGALFARALLQVDGLSS